MNTVGKFYIRMAQVFEEKIDLRLCKQSGNNFFDSLEEAKQELRKCTEPGLHLILENSGNNNFRLVFFKFV